VTPRRPRLATRARLLAASLASTANDQGAALRRAVCPSVTRAVMLDGFPFAHMEITAQ